MNGLVRAEWIRLSRRRDLWLLIVALAALVVVSYWGSLSSIESQFGWDPSQPVPSEVLAQIAAERQTFAFPQSLLTVLGTSQVLLVALLAYATAATIGAEFGYGTIRTALVAHSDRRGFLVVRLLALGLLAALLLAITLLLGMALPVVAGLFGVDLPETRGLELAGFAGLAGTFLLSGMLTIGLVATLTVLTRSAGVALILTFAYFLLEGAIVSRWQASTDAVATAVRLLPAADIQLLVAHARAAAGPVALPFIRDATPNPGEPAVTWLVVMGVSWTLAFLAAAIGLLHRADIRE